MVSEKNKFRTQPNNLAYKKTELMKRLEVAEFNNNVSEIDKLTRELDQIEEKCQQVIAQQNSRAAGLMNINKRNKLENLKFKVDEAAAAGSPSKSPGAGTNGGNFDEDNPFKRSKSRPSMLVGKQGLSQAKKLQSGALPAGEGVNGDQQSGGDLVEDSQGNGESSTPCRVENLSKSKVNNSSNGKSEPENLHDFDVNIEIVDF